MTDSQRKRISIVFNEFALTMDMHFDGVLNLFAKRNSSKNYNFFLKFKVNN